MLTNLQMAGATRGGGRSRSSRDPPSSHGSPVTPMSDQPQHMETTPTTLTVELLLEHMRRHGVPLPGTTSTPASVPSVGDSPSTPRESSYRPMMEPTGYICNSILKVLNIICYINFS